MSAKTEGTGPALPDDTSKKPDRHHRRAADLPGYVAQRLDMLENAVSSPPRPRPVRGKEASIATLVLSSGGEGHDAAVCSFLASAAQTAKSLGLEVDCTGLIRVARVGDEFLKQQTTRGQGK